MQISTQLSNYVILNHIWKTKQEETPLLKFKKFQADGQRRVSFLLTSILGLRPHLRRTLRLSAPGSARPTVRTGPRQGGGPDPGARGIGAPILQAQGGLRDVRERKRERKRER